MIRTATSARPAPFIATLLLPLSASVAWAAEQAPAAAAASATTASSATSAGNLMQVLFGLVVVLALMAGAAWLLKRMGVAGAGGNNVAKVVGGVSVGNRERVVVVEVADQWIVVGVAPGRVNALSTMPRQETAASATEAMPDAKNFASWLKQTIDKRNGN